MNIDSLLQPLRRYILNSCIRVTYFSAEEGIRFFYPVPGQTHNCVFLGNDKEWQRLAADGDLLCGCTYLVCVEQAEQVLLPPAPHLELNVIFLRMTLREAQQLIYFAFYNDYNIMQKDNSLVLKEFFKTISLQNINDPDILGNWLKQFPHPLKTFIAVIVIRPEKSLQTESLILDISDSLSSFFADTNLFFYNGEWIIFYSQEELASDSLSISYENLDRLLDYFHLNAGISYVGVIPGNIYTLYLTASASIELGLKIRLSSSRKRIFTFARYHTLYLIHLCAKQYGYLHNGASLYYMAHPDIVRIYLYDKEHSSDLLDTLYTFLTNESSLSKTAQCLYMHRNTVYGKISKIERIIGYRLSSVKDNSNFILSYMVIRYYRDYQSRDIS